MYPQAPPYPHAHAQPTPQGGWDVPAHGGGALLPGDQRWLQQLEREVTGGQPTGIAPAAPRTVRYRYRVRWDNVIIVGLAIAALVWLLPMVLRWTAEQSPIGDRAAKIVGVEPAADELEVRKDMTQDEAMQVVARARAMMQQGRFDEAAALLSTIPPVHNDATGASELRDQNSRLQQNFESYLESAADAVDAQNWAEAHRHFAAAARIAPLPADAKAQDATALRHMATDQSIARAQRLFEAGKVDEAAALAEATWKRYQDERARELLAEIEASRSAPGSGSGSGSTATPGATGGGSTTTAPPSGGSTSGGGAVPGAVSGAGTGTSPPGSSTTTPPAVGAGPPGGPPPTGSSGPPTLPTGQPAPTHTHVEGMDMTAPR